METRINDNGNWDQTNFNNKQINAFENLQVMVKISNEK